MKINLRAILLLNLTMLAAAGDEPRTGLKRVSETPEQRTQRMEWWREARFGMFVHWGLYSGLAGTWDGQPVGTRGGMEWIQQRVKADTDTYAKAAIPLFQPKPGFASEWAKLAKDTGCRYLVFTTKHHDGFALHDSKVSDYDAGSVLYRDLVKEIVDACRAEGLRVGFYHSVIDWHHDQYEYAKSKQLPHPLKGKSYPNGTREHAKYLDYLHAEVNELVSNYGKVDVLWWDYSALDFQGQEAWHAFDLMKLVREKQPEIIMNNRLFRSLEAGWTSMGTDGYSHTMDYRFGDFVTPEQHIPATGMASVDWETCMTLNTTWGYSAHDHAWKSDKDLIQNLVDIASKGGNYLLNIGPLGDGSLTPETVKSFHAIGAWMKRNGEALYATEAGPFRKLAWGRCTQKADGADTMLYLHVFDWPKDSSLLVPGLKNVAKSVALFGGGQKLGMKATPAGLQIEVPKEAPDAISTTIALRIAGSPEVEPFHILPGKDGSLLLDAANAEVSGKHLQIKMTEGKSNLEFWTNSGDQAQWPIRITQAGEYEITAKLSSEGSGKFTVAVNGQELAAKSPATGAYSQYNVSTLGMLKLDAGRHTLTVQPVAANWKPMNLRWLKLTPAPNKAE